MTDTDLAYLTVRDAGRLLRSREVSSVELTQAALRRIDEVDQYFSAFITVTADVALMLAEAADRMMRQGTDTALTGVPMAAKDILSTRGITTTCGSRVLEHYVPQYSATATRRLEEAGAVLLGKTNMDEFAMGSSNENSAFGPVRNPWDPERVPGGSSGGSAVAVAAGEAVYALGTDTGGSIRQPAALSGVVGFKPTYGRVSRYGLVAFASSLDQIGPLTRTVWDSAAVLEVMAGLDPLDSTSLDAPVPSYTSALGGDLRGRRLGVPREYFSEGMEQGVEQAIRTALAALGDLGAEIQEISLPHTQYALSTYYVISPAEAMANLARYDGVRYGLSVEGEDAWDLFGRTRESGFGPEVKRRILLGTYVLSAGYYDAYYRKALQVRTLVRQDFERAFEGVDLIVAPTSPTTAFRLGERTDNPLHMYLSDVYTVPINMAGLPAISVPAGFSEGLPVGLQFIGPALQESAILQAAHAFEQATQHHCRRPSREALPSSST
jgi:aspartyl-tRNA(Asn)/glutamyl-tRNA(Gln) amidotransferase subunit A